MRDVGIRSIWAEGTPLIGMIHLLPLPGSPAWSGSMETVLERASMDARSLTAAGFDGVMVENFSDTPFHREAVPPETVAAISAAVLEVRGTTSIPVGVNVLRNDALAAIGIATATGARYVRVNVHTGSMWTDQGLVEGRAAESLRLRAHLHADVTIFADVHVKHASPPQGSDIAASACDTWQRGRADALIVSGTGTGLPTNPTDLELVRTAVPCAPLFVGSGVTLENVSAMLRHADGAIVGTSVMTGGVAGTGVDLLRARALVEKARS